MGENVLKSLKEWSLGTCLRWRINVHPDEEDYLRLLTLEHYTVILRCWPGGGVTGVLYYPTLSHFGEVGDVFGSWNETRICLFVIFRGGSASGILVNSVMKFEGIWSDMGMGEKETEMGKEEEGEKKVKVPGKYAKVTEGRVISSSIKLYDGDNTFDQGKDNVLRGKCDITCVGHFEDEVECISLSKKCCSNCCRCQRCKEYLLSLPEDHHMFDFKIICSDGKEVKSNKFILASQNKYFEGLFRRENCDSVELDYQGDFVKACIHFLHTQEIEITGDIVQDILVTANYLLIDEIVEMSINHILDNMDVTNCVDILKFGVQFDLSKLIDTATNAICYNLDSLDDDTVKLIPLEMFKSILTNDHVCLRNSSKIILTDSEKKKKLRIEAEKYCHNSNQLNEKEALLDLVNQLPVKKSFFSVKSKERIGENISSTNFKFVGQGIKFIKKVAILTSQFLIDDLDFLRKKMVSGLTLEWTDGTVDKVGEEDIEAEHEIVNIVSILSQYCHSH